MSILTNYWKPTPKKWRMLGDSLLAISGTVCGGGLIAYDELAKLLNTHELKLILGLSLLCGIAGKFLTNMFKVDDTANDNTRDGFGGDIKSS